MNMRSKWFLAVIALMMTAIQARSQQANTSKMSAMLVDKLTENVAAARVTGQSPVTEEYVLALVKLDGKQKSDILQQHGCVVIDRVGSISIALLPVSQLGLLSMDDHVVRMEANPLSRPMLDITPAAVNALPAYRGEQLPQAFTGRGVVVGVADIGFDYTHPMFCDANGQTRIRQAWDIYTGGNDGYKNIGTLYNSPETLAEARGSSDSTQYHGTHVAAIAVGSSACGGRFQGIAHEADIVLSQASLSTRTTEQYKTLVASLNATLDAGTADPLVVDAAKKRITVSNAMEALAIKYIMDYAEEHGQPCVVNCSFGSQQRLTENNAVEEELINSLTGPGRIIVSSAGNFSDGIIYKTKSAHERMDDELWLRSSLEPMLTLRSAGDFTLKLRPSIDGADTLTITAESIRQAGSIGRKDSAAIHNDKMTDGWLYTVSKAYENVFPGLTSYAVELKLPKPTSAYTKPSVTMILDGDETEVMGQSNALAFNPLKVGGYVNNAPYTVGTPASFTEVIAVGMTSHRDSVENLSGNRLTHTYNNNALGMVVSWSGTGPTLEGRMKPDVVAPGHNIVSAFNSNVPQNAVTDKVRSFLVATDTIDGKGYQWKAESGTSMAAPVVTGTIALWLQANPQLTPDDIKQILAHTARHPEADETYPNYRYGYGEIDAYKGLLYITELTGIEGLSDHQPQHLTFRLTGRTLTLIPFTHHPSPFTLHPSLLTITVYSIGGQPVLRAQPTDGTVDLSSLRPGIYAVQVDSGEAATTGSTLIRLQ